MKQYFLTQPFNIFNFLPLLLSFQFAIAQLEALTVIITGIKHEKVANEICYYIHYKVQNNQNHDIKCFFNPDDFGLSLSTRKIFSLYENGSRFDGKSFLNPQPQAKRDEYAALISASSKDTTEIKKKIALLQSIADYDVETAKRVDFGNYFLEKSTKRYQKDVMLFAPNEAKTFIQKMFWQKNRYYQEGDFEYYLNEKNKYEIQFLVILNKKQLKNQLTEKYYLEVLKDKNFIEGVFSSNKIQIEFKD